MDKNITQKAHSKSFALSLHHAFGAAIRIFQRGLIVVFDGWQVIYLGFRVSGILVKVTILFRPQKKFSMELRVDWILQVMFQTLIFTHVSHSIHFFYFFIYRRDSSADHMFVVAA